MSLALDQHPLVQDTVGPQCSIRIEVFAINRTPAPGSGPPRSAFHYLADLLRITRSGSEQFHARLWLTNATRLSGMEWVGLRRGREWVTGGSRCRINQETVRIYIIGNDGITLCRGALATGGSAGTHSALGNKLRSRISLILFSREMRNNAVLTLALASSDRLVRILPSRSHCRVAKRGRSGMAHGRLGS